MPVEFEVSLVQVGNSLRMTVPKEVAKALGMKKGDKLAIQVMDHHMQVRKVTV